MGSAAFWWTLLAIGLLGLALTIVLIVRIRKPKIVPVLTDVRGEQEEETETSSWNLKTWWRETLRTLFFLGERREWRYELPWLLVCGETGSGKTSLIASITGGRRENLSAREQKLGIDGTEWNFFDRGVLIDVGGVVATAEEGDVRGRRWREIFSRLSDYRPERAIDGVVLTVSARTLLNGTGADKERLAQRCRMLLWELQTRFEFAFPVYVVVTQCDTVDGFGAYWKAQPESRRAEMIGWSNPYSLDNGFVAEWIDAAFDSIGRALKRLQLQAAATAERNIEQVDEFFLFPQRFRELQRPLRGLLAQVFRSSAYHANSFLRGVYFVGSVGADGVAVPRTRNDVAFVDALVEEKVLAELNLARPIRQALWSRHRLIRRLQFGAAMIFILLCLSLVDAGIRLDRQVKTGVASIELIQNPQRLSRDDGACVDKATAYELLTNVSSLEVNPTFLAIPASWFDRRIAERGMHVVADSAFEEVVFPSLACHLERRAHNLLADANETEPVKPDRDALREYLDSILTFERNLERFRHLVVYASRDQVDTLMEKFQALALYLYNEPLPAPVRQRHGLHSDALTHVEYQHEVALPNDMRASIARRITAMTERVRKEIDRDIGAGAVLIETLQREEPPILDNIQRFERWLDRLRNEWLTATEQSNPCRQITDWFEPGTTELHRQYRYDGSLPKLARAFDRRVCYDVAIRRMGQLQVAPYGMLLQHAHERWDLVPAAAADVEGLKKAVALDFMRLAPREPFACRIPLRGWRAPDLAEAGGFVRSYQQFAQAHPSATDAAQRPLHVRLAARQLNFVLDDVMNRAQLRAGYVDARAAMLVSPVSTLDQRIEQEAGDFSRSLEPLVWVLRAYRQLGFDASHALVTQCARNYALESLRTVQILSDTSRLYDPGSAIATSDDTGGPRLLFALGDASQTKEYLDRQLRRAQVLSAHASPFVSFLKNTDGVNDVSDGGYWDRTIDELNRFVQFKVPNGQVALLNDFVSNQLGKLTSDDCRQILVDYKPALYGDDLFSRRRRGLERHAQWQCRDRGRAMAYAQYQGLAQQFTGELSTRFPFGQTESEDAPLGVVRRFFFDYAQQRDGMRAKFANSKLDESNEIAIFLDQLDQVSTFFGSQTGADAMPPVRIKVEFRAAAKHSLGTQNLLSWRLSNGSTQASFPNGRTEIDWRYGQPLSLELTWADLSTVVPHADTAQRDLQVTRNVATFTADGPWALFRLMARHVPQAAPRVDPSDPTLTLLEFRVPVGDRRAPEGADPLSDARVYLGFKFYGVDPKTQAAVPLKPPRSFPRNAPTVW
ncbi:MAG TPA: type VI secretion system protein [Burkholderiales bacterium]|nr:type VI secretion system protein [Burkholderiales bacterium]